MGYGFEATDYLARARDCLKSSKDDDLFYAAFELRCCIEKRQSGYLEALESYSLPKVKRWKVGATSRILHDVWDDPKISSILFLFNDGLKVQTYYTPITQNLVKAAERDLGEMLHSIEIERDSIRKWLRSKRTRLTNIYREAWVACQGQHMAPPLWNAETRETHPFHLVGGEEVKLLFERLELVPDAYSKFKLQIDYLDQPPSHWMCDL